MTTHFSFDSSTPIGDAIMPAAPQAGRLSNPVHVSNSSILETFSVTPPAAGISINERNANTLSAVWCAINLIANTIAMMPLHLYKRTSDDSRVRADDHRLMRNIGIRPNPAMTWFTFSQTVQGHVLTWGRGSAEIERNRGGDVIGLWPITPDSIRADVDLETGLPFYWVVDADGREVPMEAEDILWIPGMGFDGLQGYSPVRLARESLGLVAAAERYGANFFGGDGQPAGVLTMKGKLGKEHRENMREEWRSIYGGGSRSGRIAILKEGTSFEKISVPPEDSQFIETRKFGILEIARWFNIPPHKLKDLDRATFSNIEEQGAEFLTDTILPWLVLWTQEMAYKLLDPAERSTHYFEHTFEHIMRARVRDRYQAYAVARQWGWMSVNDVRRKENLPLIGPEGDVYMVPANMMPASQFLRPRNNNGQQSKLLGPDGRSIQEYMRVAV